jgi:hypothetical protein
MTLQNSGKVRLLFEENYYRIFSSTEKGAEKSAEGLEPVLIRKRKKKEEEPIKIIYSGGKFSEKNQLKADLSECDLLLLLCMLDVEIYREKVEKKFLIVKLIFSDITNYLFCFFSIFMCGARRT